jgi:hypothetical protein
MTYSLEDLKAMIPIYLNGRLSPPEAEAFEEGLRLHPALERELMEFSEIQESYAVIEDNMPLDSDALFGRIRHGIRSESRQISQRRRNGIFARLLQLAKDAYRTPALSWSLAGLQFAALLALIVFVPKQVLFKTYTSTSPTDKNRVRINVVFVQEAREIQIRTLLQELGATIISGPNANGLYVLDVQATTDIDVLIEKLNQSPIVRLAERSLSRLDRQRPSRQAFNDRLKQFRPAISMTGVGIRPAERLHFDHELGFEC